MAKERKEELSRREIAGLLYKSAAKFFEIFSAREMSITLKEVHLTDSLRVDIFNISYKEKVVIVELKTCKEDFKTDTKWKKYLDYCHRFYIMCPTGVISRTDLPDEVGLIYVDLTNKDNPYIRVNRGPKELKPKYITNSWLNKMFRKIAFRKFINYNGKIVSFEDVKLF